MTRHGRPAAPRGGPAARRRVPPPDHGPLHLTPPRRHGADADPRQRGHLHHLQRLPVDRSGRPARRPAAVAREHRAHPHRSRPRPAHLRPVRRLHPERLPAPRLRAQLRHQPRRARPDPREPARDDLARARRRGGLADVRPLHRDHLRRQAPHGPRPPGHRPLARRDLGARLLARPRVAVPVRARLRRLRPVVRRRAGGLHAVQRLAERVVPGADPPVVRARDHVRRRLRATCCAARCSTCSTRTTSAPRGPRASRNGA